MNLISLNEMKKKFIFFMLKPSSAIYGVIFSICSFFIFFILWACFFKIDEVVKADCILRPNQNVSSIKSLANGEIKEINYKNNQTIIKGDLLFALNVSVYEQEKESLEDNLVKIKNELNWNNNLGEIITSNYSNKQIETIIQQTKDEEKLMIQDYLFEKKQYEININEAKIYLEREKNLPEELKIQQRIIDAERNLNNVLLQYDNWKNNYSISISKTIKTLHNSEKETESKIIELNQLINNSLIYAPISGQIFEIKKMNKGDSIFAGEEILRIIPNEDEYLTVQIYVKGEDIIKIEEGNRVYIKFENLPSKEYGVLETEVSEIPPDAIFDDTTKPYFIVESFLKSTFITPKNEKRIRLLPGIKGKAIIKVAENTVINQFLKKMDFIK